MLLDEAPIGEELELSFVHDFLDAYLTSITIGSAPRFVNHDEEVPGKITMLNVSGSFKARRFIASVSLTLVNSMSSHNLTCIRECSREDIAVKWQ